MAELRSGDKRWALLERYNIADTVDPTDTYLARLRIIETPWFGVYLHQIRRPDHDRALHDHPWNFVSFIIKGGYEETVPMFISRPAGLRRKRTWGPRSIHAMGIGKYHAITRLLDGPAWTLVFVGRRVKNWGYITESGWIDHDTYHVERGIDGSED